MRRTSGRISRRQFSKLLGGSVLALPSVMQQSGAQQPSPKAEPVEARWTDAQKREAQKALEALEKELQTLRKFELPTDVEPCFVFRALPPSRSAGSRRVPF